MKYNFDKELDRRNTGSLKWDVAENELPMWVADMDFETAPAIHKTILERATHGAFGYSVVTEEWYDAYIRWWEKRHHFKIEKEWMCFCTGVVPAISSLVRKMTTVAENVLVQPPVYHIFFNSIYNNGRYALESPLKYDGTEYQIDWEDLEEKLANPQTMLMILCNPHNPVGKIWDRETLARIGELCYKHHVIVVSDEIHCDLTDPDCEYVPFASVSEICAQNSITCIAPTKTFNIAGIQTSAVVVPNEALRRRVVRGLNTDEIAEGNVFAVGAAIAAFNEGGEWLDELRRYIKGNKDYVRAFVKEQLPQIKVVPSDATYLLWLDCSQVTEDSVKLCQFIRKETGLYLSEGQEYGGNGNQFLRMNLACQKTKVIDACERLKRAVLVWERE